MAQLTTESGWPALFWHAFRESRSAMVLLDDARRHVEVNEAYLQLLGHRRDELIGRPVYELRARGSPLSSREWKAALAQPQFAGSVDLARADGQVVTVDFAGYPEAVTGKRLILCVALKARRAGTRGEGWAPAPPPTALTQREREVVGLLALGLTGPEVAGELYVTHNTVRTHISNAMTKLGARSRAQLVARTLAEMEHLRAT